MVSNHVLAHFFPILGVTPTNHGLPIPAAHLDYKTRGNAFEACVGALLTYCRRNRGSFSSILLYTQLDNFLVSAFSPTTMRDLDRLAESYHRRKGLSLRSLSIIEVDHYKALPSPPVPKLVTHGKCCNCYEHRDKERDGKERSYRVQHRGNHYSRARRERSDEEPEERSAKRSRHTKESRDGHHHDRETHHSRDRDHSSHSRDGGNEREGSKARSGRDRHADAGRRADRNRKRDRRDREDPRESDDRRRR